MASPRAVGGKLNSEQSRNQTPPPRGDRRRRPTAALHMLLSLSEFIAVSIDEIKGELHDSSRLHERHWLRPAGDIVIAVSYDAAPAAASLCLFSLSDYLVVSPRSVAECRAVSLRVAPCRSVSLRVARCRYVSRLSRDSRAI
ncbi:hypothetical protein JYU34_010667 [Plutella xylostella]|uniref:Uncharacterized protein n=1 Tax=Plutella xylostella TaxID=51655 RepID=A0ABQ7QF04_PLUXY|nr:hypothetical protein JYU34_010667 [Plutella xylostella]